MAERRRYRFTARRRAMLIQPILPEWQALEEYRLEHNLGIEELCERINVDRRHLRKVMTGRAAIGPRVRARVYAFLNVDPDEWAEAARE